MHRGRRIFGCAVVSLSLVASALPLAAQADDEQFCRRVSGSSPALGVETVLAVGNVAWEVHEYLTCAYVHIKQEFPVLGGKRLLDADAWIRDNGKAGYRACTIDWSPGACFEDHDLDGVFEWGNGFWAPRPTGLRLPYKVQWREENDGSGSRQELILMGADADRARFSLREFVHDLKAPKTVSEVWFPLKGEAVDAPFREFVLSLRKLEDGRLAVIVRKSQ